MDYLGKEKIPTDLFTTAVNRMRSNGGNPGAQAGANRVDVALHWMYRACLTDDADLLKEAMDYIYSTVVYTTRAEGIQYDNSFTQHGRQLHIGAYRGEYISYNVIGRASSRPNATKKTGQTSIMKRMKDLDPVNAATYDEAIARIGGSETSAFGVKAGSNHFFRSDYTVHRRPAYTVDLRMVSTRTARNEYLKDNGEGIKQYFMSDGAMAILTKFVGGVTDSLYAVSAYRYADYDTQFAVNTEANKAWFFFDNEIVCLGNGIQSASPFQVNTTLNQCLLSGDVVVSANGSQSTLTKGAHDYDNNLDWVHHGNVGYYFPQKGKIELSAAEQSGRWTDINTNYSGDLLYNDVFTLSFNHGINPVNDSYAYILVPGVATPTEAAAYDTSVIDIIVNSDSVQAVHHKTLGVYGMVFCKAAGFKKNGLTVEADAPCIVLIKDSDKANVIVYVSDPTNGTTGINLGIETPQVKSRRQVTYQGEAPYEGVSQKFVVNESTPLSQGRDRLADRSQWTITTSINGPADSEPLVGGDNPQYIIDESTNSAFLFVKPGKTFSGIVAPADYIPSFTIDMQSPQEMEYFIYRHRDYNNALEYLRAKKISFYGKDNEADEFAPILEGITLQTTVAENKVKLPAKVSHRYVKVMIDEWDTASGSTIQVADFNIGKWR